MGLGRFMVTGCGARVVVFFFPGQCLGPTVSDVV